MRATIAGAALVAVVLFRDHLSSFEGLAGLAIFVLVYTGSILLLVNRFPTDIRTSRTEPVVRRTWSEARTALVEEGSIRENAARRKRNRASIGSFHISSMVVQAITKAISAGPEPTVWYAM